MFGISETELLIIIVFGFLVFGPDKLPGMGRTLGRMLRQFREAQQGFTEVVQTEVMDPLNDVLSDPLAEGAKGTKKDRAAALAEDSDIELPEGATAPKRETFAERKARLAAEREAAAAAAAEAQEETDETEVAEANEAMETTAQEPELSVVVESEEPDTSANALYALGGRTSGYRSLSQKKADEAAAKAKADEAAAKAEAEAEAKVDEAAAKAEAEAEAKAADAVEKADAPAPELNEPAIEAVPAGPTKVDEGGEGSAKA